MGSGIAHGEWDSDTRTEPSLLFQPKERLCFIQVSATFRRIFPDSFDRAIPIIRHKEVDKLLLQLDMAMWRYENVRTVGNQAGAATCLDFLF